jgi:enoyl-CoA hydratase/carnithine racemase
MKPFMITVWNGFVIGGAVGLSSHAKIRIATERTVLSVPETSIGWITDCTATYLLARIQNNLSLGLYLGVTGKRVRGKELVNYGLATHYITSDKLDALYMDLITNVTQASTDVEIRAIVDKYGSTDFDKRVEAIENY